MKCLFFGVKSPNELGHFLYDERMQKVWCDDDALPFRQCTLDAGLLPVGKPEVQAEHYLSHINGWTVLGMWDRTGDKRGASNASFIIEGEFDKDEAEAVASARFQTVSNRIHRLVPP